MHWGLPLDDEHGMCAEGKRGAKYLGLILVPKSMQTKYGFKQTAIFDELNFERACAIAELVTRGKGEDIGEGELNHAVETLELVITKANRRTSK